MRASTLIWIGSGLSGLLLTSLSGCSKEIKADFPRPPATAALPTPEEPRETPATPETQEPAESGTTETEPAEEPEPAPAPVAPKPRPRPAEVPPDEAEAAPEPTSTTLSGAGEVDPEIAAKLSRADVLVEALGSRKLTSEQAQQLTAAESFVSQARKALKEGDPRRAVVLLDKGLILAQDVERLSRP